MDINCNVGMLNTGQSCVPVMKVQKKFIAVQTYDSTGVLNEIDLTAGPFNAAYFAARVNDVDDSKRWYPLPQVKNVSNERADSLMETFDDGSKVYIEKGIRTVSGLIIASDAPPRMIRKINSMRGLGMSIYAVDKESNLIGKVGSSATKFAPIQLEQDTIDAILVLSQDKTIQKIKISFDISVNEDDADMAMILSTEMAYNLNNLRGLIDVTSELSAISTAAFTAELLTDGGTPLNPTTMQGLVTADFVSSVTGATGKVRDVTSATDKTVTVAETPAGSGIYVITPSAPFTALHVLEVQIVKAGYDYTAVLANTVAIP